MARSSACGEERRGADLPIGLPPVYSDDIVALKLGGVCTSRGLKSAVFLHYYYPPCFFDKVEDDAVPRPITSPGS